MVKIQKENEYLEKDNSYLTQKLSNLIYDISKLETLKKIEFSQSKEIVNLRESLKLSKTQLKTIEGELNKLKNVVKNCNNERNILLDEILNINKMPSLKTLDVINRSFLKPALEEYESEQNQMLPNLENNK